MNGLSSNGAKNKITNITSAAEGGIAAKCPSAMGLLSVDLRNPLQPDLSAGHRWANRRAPAGPDADVERHHFATSSLSPAGANRSIVVCGLLRAADSPGLVVDSGDGGHVVAEQL